MTDTGGQQPRYAEYERTNEDAASGGKTVWRGSDEYQNAGHELPQLFDLSIAGTAATATLGNMPARVIGLLVLTRGMPCRHSSCGLRSMLLLESLVERESQNQQVLRVTHIGSLALSPPLVRLSLHDSVLCGTMKPLLRSVRRFFARPGEI